MREENIFQIEIDGHMIDYYWDGMNLVTFKPPIKITGMHTKMMRHHAECNASNNI